jgi:hypothetical protein
VPSFQLPDRPSLEYLRKLAKERLRELRRTDPHAKLTTALLGVARDYGFPSWRALKEEVDRRVAANAAAFVDACDRGDLEAVREALARDPGLVRAAHPAGHGGWTGLHSAAKKGHLAVARLLLEHGADPNSREVGDITYPLHWAAAGGHLDVMRSLVDAGGDVNGFGDVHENDVIGWATACPTPAAGVALLIDRGARHHIFSAIALGNLELIRQVVEENPDALDRRRSRFEKGATVLHDAIERKRHDILDVLIELGADLEAEDMNGRTALAVAMLQGDREAMRRLHAAGAKPPAHIDASDFRTRMARLASSVKSGSVTIGVPDVGAALAWYVSIGFTEGGRWEDDGVVNFGIVRFGGADLMFNPYLTPAPKGVAFWFRTDRIDEIYEVLKARQLEAAAAALVGDTGNQGGIEFAQDIENMFYGARQFGIRDLNGYMLYFIQQIPRTSSAR